MKSGANTVEPPSRPMETSRRGTLDAPLLVRDVMMRDVITTAPETMLEDAGDLLVKHHISGMPIVRGSMVVGVLSEKDILRCVLSKVGRSQLPAHLLALFHEFSAEQAGKTLNAVRHVLRTTPVSEAMSGHPILVAPDTGVDQAARLMIERKIHRLPVVDRGKLVGIVTREDMMRSSAGIVAAALP
jgi:CBS domain-containing protein